MKASVTRALPIPRVNKLMVDVTMDVPQDITDPFAGRNVRTALRVERVMMFAQHVWRADLD